MIANKLELFFISIICAKKQPSIFSILLLSSNFKAIDEILNFPKTSFTAPKLGKSGCSSYSLHNRRFVNFICNAWHNNIDISSILCKGLNNNPLKIIICTIDSFLS